MLGFEDDDVVVADVEIDRGIAGFVELVGVHLDDLLAAGLGFDPVLDALAEVAAFAELAGDDVVAGEGCEAPGFGADGEFHLFAGGWLPIGIGEVADDGAGGCADHAEGVAGFDDFAGGEVGFADEVGDVGGAG